MALKFGSNSDDVNTLVYDSQDVKVLKQGSTVVGSKPIKLTIDSCNYGTIGSNAVEDTLSEPKASNTSAGIRTNFNYDTSGTKQIYYGDKLTLWYTRNIPSGYLGNNSSFTAQCYKGNSSVGSAGTLSSYDQNLVTYNPTLDGDTLKLRFNVDIKLAKGTFTTTQTGSTSGYANKRLGCSTSSTYTDNTYPASPQTFTGISYENQSVYGYITVPYGGNVLGGDDVGQVVVQGQTCHVWRTHIGTTMNGDNANTSKVFNAQVYHMGTKLIDSSKTSSAQNFNTILASAASYQEDEFYLIYVQITNIYCNNTLLGDVYVSLPYYYETRTIQSGNYKLVFTFSSDGTNIFVQTSQQHTGGGGSYQVKFNYKVYAMIQ